MANPFEEAGDAIAGIYEQLTTLSLDAPAFPNIENPLVPMNLGTTLPNIGAETLPTSGISPNIVAGGGGGGFGNIPFNQMTTEQKLDILFGRS